MTTEQSNSPIGETLPRSFKVLITGAGSPGAVGIIKYLKVFYNVTAVDCDFYSAGFRYCDNFYVVPKAGKKFIKALYDICLKDKIQVVFPKVTAELEYLSAAKKKFQKIGTTIMISDKPAVLTANDKYRLYTKLQGSVRVPKHFLAEDRFCSKPVTGSGGRGFKVYEGSCLVSEYIPGDEYSVDILADNGKAITIIPRIREKVKAGVSVEGTVIMDKEIIEASRIAVEKLKLHGIVGLQFRRDKNFNPVIIECNPRIQGTVMLAEAAGAQLFHNAVNIATGNEITPPTIRDGTKMRRYWTEDYE